jgi:hypothetical protein
LRSDPAELGRQKSEPASNLASFVAQQAITDYRLPRRRIEAHQPWARIPCRAVCHGILDDSPRGVDRVVQLNGGDARRQRHLLSGMIRWTAQALLPQNLAACPAAPIRRHPAIRAERKNKLTSSFVWHWLCQWHSKQQAAV